MYKFRKMQEVRVIDPESRFFDEVFLIRYYLPKLKQYCLQEKESGTSLELYFHPYEIAPVLDAASFRQITLVFLYSLAEEAVNTNDREWFDDIHRRIRLVLESGKEKATA